MEPMTFDDLISDHRQHLELAETETAKQFHTDAIEFLEAKQRDENLWPEWATTCLKLIREVSGYDGYDDAEGVDLPEELRELIHELSRSPGMNDRRTMGNMNDRITAFLKIESRLNQIIREGAPDAAKVIAFDMVLDNSKQHQKALTEKLNRELT